MLDPLTTLYVGVFCGGLFGYAVGFLIAMAIYRPAWHR